MKFRNRLSKRMLIVAVAAVSHSQASAQNPFQDIPFEVPEASVKVRDDLYVLQSLRGNVTVLLTDEGALLVDNRRPEDFDAVVAAVARLTDRPIRYVINTHRHFDHLGGNARMREAGAVAISSTNARAAGAGAGNLGPWLPDITLDDHLRVHLGGVPVDVYFFGRAHTNGDVVVHFPRHGVVAMGDIMAASNRSTMGISYAEGGSALEWLGTLDGVLGLRFETVVPGHDVVTDRARLETYRKDIARIISTVRELIRKGRPRSDIESMLREEFGWWGPYLRQPNLDGLIKELSGGDRTSREADREDRDGNQDPRECP